MVMANGTADGNIKLPFNIAYQIIVIVITIASLVASYKVLTHFTLRDIQENKYSIAKCEDVNTAQEKEISQIEITMEGLKTDVSNIKTNVQDVKNILVRGNK